jgi:hypothetical protein
MAEPDGDDTDEEMDYLDYPVVRAWKQAQLCGAQRRDDQAPDEHEQSEASGPGREESEHGENPHADDEEAAERRMNGQQRQGVARPEQDPEHHQSDAEEAEE